MLIFSAGSAPATLDIVTGIHRTGLGFTAREWHESETMEYVQSLDQQAVLISNAPESIMLFSGRSAYPVPSLPTGDARAPEPAGRDSASALDTLVCGDGALLVVFDRSLDGTDPRFDATLALESFSCDVASIFRGTDGVVYSNQLAP